MNDRVKVTELIVNLAQQCREYGYGSLFHCMFDGRFAELLEVAPRYYEQWTEGSFIRDLTEQNKDILSGFSQEGFLRIERDAADLAEHLRRVGIDVAYARVKPEKESCIIL